MPPNSRSSSGAAIDPPCCCTSSSAARSRGPSAASTRLITSGSSITAASAPGARLADSGSDQSRARVARSESPRPSSQRRSVSASSGFRVSVCRMRPSTTSGRNKQYYRRFAATRSTISRILLQNVVLYQVSRAASWCASICTRAVAKSLLTGVRGPCGPREFSLCRANRRLCRLFALQIKGCEGLRPSRSRHWRRHRMY
jgi:hypothetical protein